MGKAKSNGTHPGLYKRGRYWWLSRDPVTGRAESTRCTSLKAAQACLAERERLSADPTYAASQAARLGSQVAAFLEMKGAAKRSAATMGYYREKLGHWLRMFGDAPLARFVDPATFDSFVAQRRDEGASDHTISKEVRVFSQVLKMAKRAGHYGGDITILKPHDLTTSYVPRTRAMTTDEAARLWPELSTRWAALLDISVALGLRLSECAKIDPQRDVDLVTGLVTIRGTKTKGSARIVPILSPFRPLLERALPHLPVGPGNNLYRDVANACKRAGVQYATPNDWRRSHATILAELGVDADVLRRLLGHTTRQMVDRIYSQPRPESIGQLAELAIARRSAGVAKVADYGECMAGPTLAKCAESQESLNQERDQDGFLSRRSQVQILSGARNIEARRSCKSASHGGTQLGDIRRCVRLATPWWVFVSLILSLKSTHQVALQSRAVRSKPLRSKQQATCLSARTRPRFVAHTKRGRAPTPGPRARTSVSQRPLAHSKDRA